MIIKKINEYKVVILFYVVLVIFSFFYSFRIEQLDKLENNNTNNLITIVK